MLHPWFVTGFCDGQAVFTYSKSGTGFNMYFSLRQGNENQHIVEEIHKFFDFKGSIYKNKGIVSRKEETSRPQPSVYYRVSRVDQLKRIVEHFDIYPLQSRKQDSYLIWRKMVLHKIESFRNADYDLLSGLARQLTLLNQKTAIPRVHKR